MSLPTTSPRDLLAWLNRKPGAMVTCTGGRDPWAALKGVPLPKKPVSLCCSKQHPWMASISLLFTSQGSVLFGQVWAQQCQAGLSKACLCQMMLQSCWTLTG